MNIGLIRSEWKPSPKQMELWEEKKVKVWSNVNPYINIKAAREANKIPDHVMPRTETEQKRTEREGETRSGLKGL